MSYQPSNVDAQEGLLQKDMIAAAHTSLHELDSSLFYWYYCFGVVPLAPNARNLGHASDLLHPHIQGSTQSRSALCRTRHSTVAASLVGIC